MTLSTRTTNATQIQVRETLGEAATIGPSNTCRDSRRVEGFGPLTLLEMNRRRRREYESASLGVVGLWCRSEALRGFFIATLRER